MNEQSINEVKEVCKFLVSKYELHKDDYGIGRIISDINYNFQDKYLSILESSSENINSIKKEFNEELKKYIDLYEEKFGNRYTAKLSIYSTPFYESKDVKANLFYVTKENIELKYNETIDKLMKLKEFFVEYSNSNPKIYKYTSLAKEEVSRVQNDISRLKDPFNDLLNSLSKATSTYDFVTEIPTISFLEKWHNFLGTCFSYIRTHQNELDRCMFATP